ncbi:MAG: outer membrane lipoprotein-sorting protein [Gammaproteobacteria bacterium]|nr:outer membrane lipoprotein-sorting protein [Gammaproteobacteria bacterium]
MYKIIAIIAILLVNPPFSVATPRNWTERIERADTFRLTSASARIELQVQTFMNNQLEKTRDYRVFVAPGRRALALFRSEVERGQKVLVNGDQYFLFMPDTRRAIRITPMQKLLGEASTGDITSLTWAEDYTVAAALADEVIGGVTCAMFALQAARTGVTYDRVELCLDKQRDAPVYARLYLKSGKLAKEAFYERGQLNGREIIVGISLVDRIKSAQRTTIRYTAIKDVKVPDKYFNAEYLIHNPVDD